MNDRPCGCHKRLFPDWDTAMAAALRVSFRLGRALRVYECPTRPGFHLTKRPTWKAT